MLSSLSADVLHAPCAQHAESKLWSFGSMYLDESAKSVSKHLIQIPFVVCAHSPANIQAHPLVRTDTQLHCVA